ncbi:MAG: hypothetical protein M3159_07020 [Actinomycetota bacterium]|nr:hypothetical protein [Actinomycetota bacterium]
MGVVEGQGKMSVSSASPSGEERPGGAGPTAIGGPYPETLLNDLEELGLNGSQARVLLALLQLGSGNSTEIARLAQVPRTAVYPLLQELGSKRLAARVSSDGPAVWASPGRDEVLNRLDAAHETRMREQQARAVRVRKTLEEVVPAVAGNTLPFVQFIPGAAQAREVYEQLVASATTELLVFSRPPYSSPAAPVNPVLSDSLARGVKVQVLFESPTADSAEQRRHMFDTYAQLGVEARMLDRLPVKLVIVDGHTVLVTIPDPNMPDGGFPTSLLVENEDYAALETKTFETYWALGKGLGE